jgi:hypothetical protein
VKLLYFLFFLILIKRKIVISYLRGGSERPLRLFVHILNNLILRLMSKKDQKISQNKSKEPQQLDLFFSQYDFIKQEQLNKYHKILNSKKGFKRLRRVR